MQRIDTTKSKAHLALWRFLRTKRTAADLAPLAEQLDALAKERDNLKAIQDPNASTKVVTLGDQVRELERDLSRAQCDLSDARVERDQARRQLAEANKRGEQLEELLRIMGVEGFGLEYALKSVCPDRALRFATAGRFTPTTSQEPSLLGRHA